MVKSCSNSSCVCVVREDWVGASPGSWGGVLGLKMARECCPPVWGGSASFPHPSRSQSALSPGLGGGRGGIHSRVPQGGWDSPWEHPNSVRVVSTAWQVPAPGVGTQQSRALWWRCPLCARDIPGVQDQDWGSLAAWGVLGPSQPVSPAAVPLSIPPCTCLSVQPSLCPSGLLLSICPSSCPSLLPASICLSTQPCTRLAHHPSLPGSVCPSSCPSLPASICPSLPVPVSLSVCPCPSVQPPFQPCPCPSVPPHSHLSFRSAEPVSVCPSPFLSPLVSLCPLGVGRPIATRPPGGSTVPRAGSAPAHSAPWRPGPGCAGARPGREQKRAPPANGSTAEGSGPADWRRLDQWRGSAARPSEPTWGGGTGPERSSPDRS